MSKKSSLSELSKNSFDADKAEERGVDIAGKILDLSGGKD
jgi:hypothetical protein